MVVNHEESAADRSMMAKVRLFSAAGKGVLERAAFDQVMEHTPPAPGVTYEEATVGGVPGWWCRPPTLVSGSSLLYLHGGAYGLGTAKAYRSLVGHIALRAGRAAFAPDYRLAPEHPFPAAVTDAQDVYRALVAQGVTRLSLVGDSAGGGLALVLLAWANAEAKRGSLLRPHNAVALSPWTDLALTGSSMATRAEDDPFLTRAALASAAAAYLGKHDPKDPLASPLYGDPEGLPATHIHVGTDEILFDDARRYAERAGAGVELHVWSGMPHVFVSSVGMLAAADLALDAIGRFLRE